MFVPCDAFPNARPIAFPNAPYQIVQTQEPTTMAISDAVESDLGMTLYGGIKEYANSQDFQFLVKLRIHHWHSTIDCLGFKTSDSFVSI